MPLPPLTFPGDVTADIAGRVLGPDTLGGYVAVVDARYDDTTNRTVVTCRPMRPDDPVRVDPHGQLYLTEDTQP